MPLKNVKPVITEIENFINGIQTPIARYNFTTKSVVTATLLCIGDSMYEGTGSSSEPNKLITKIQAQIQTNQVGYSEEEYTFFPSYAVVGTSAAITMTGTYATVSNVNSSPLPWVQTETDTDTFDVLSYGYNSKILFASDDAITGKTPGTLDRSIDGGSITTIDLAGEDKYKWVNTGATAGTTTVSFEVNIAEGQSVAFQSIHLQTGLEGLKVVNYGIGGTTAKDWADQENIIDAFKPECTMIGLGGNDIVNSLSIESDEINLSSLIVKCQTHGDVILTFYAPIVTADPTFLANIPIFEKVAEKVAEKYNVKYINFNKVLVDGATATANDLMADALHPNDNGYEVLYRYFKSGVEL